MVISNDIALELYFILFQAVYISQLSFVLWKLWPIIPFLKELGKVFWRRKDSGRRLGVEVEHAGRIWIHKRLSRVCWTWLRCLQSQSCPTKECAAYKAKKTFTPPVLTSWVLSLFHFIFTAVLCLQMGYLRFREVKEYEDHIMWNRSNVGGRHLRQVFSFQEQYFGHASHHRGSVWPGPPSQRI